MAFESRFLRSARGDAALGVELRHLQISPFLKLWPATCPPPPSRAEQEIYTTMLLYVCVTAGFQFSELFQIRFQQFGSEFKLFILNF